MQQKKDEIILCLSTDSTHSYQKLKEIPLEKKKNPSFSPDNPQLEILIPAHYQFGPLVSFFLLLFIALSLTPPLPPYKKKATQLEKLQSLETQLVKLQSFQGKEAMKVHPLPKKRKLRRLPHIFNRVLELPFKSDADVSVEEGPDFFRFVVEAEAIAGGVRAHMVEIYPGVTKIVVRPNGYLGFASLDELELDMWRFRLPDSTRPELASAVFEGGELVVTVPKGEEDDDDGDEFVGSMGNNSPSARLVFVQ